MTKHTFKAYDHRGRLVESTWTKVPAAYEVERAAFQLRVNRGDLSRVEIFSTDVHEATVTLHPQRAVLRVVGSR